MVFRRFSGVVGFLFLMLFFLSFRAYAARDSGQAASIPWSGYWWPFAYGGLATGFDYRGHPAPLEKYLMLTTGGSSGSAVDWYKAHYYDPDAESWWGLCPAFARAAIIEAYPVFPSSEENIVFRVGDKKGLLTLCHDDPSGVVYSNENPLTPMAFHYWLLYYIGDLHKAFTADLSLGTEVWYFPVYGYEMESFPSGLTEYVSVTIYYADDHVPPDYMGTFQRQKTYTYELYLDASSNIVGGSWTEASESDHPDTLAFKEVIGALNPYLDCEKIRAIARSKDDHLETPDNAPTRLLPGTHNLVLLNEDVYTLEGKPGDMVMLEITRQEGSAQEMRIEILDNEGAVVGEDILSQSGSSVEFQLDLENPPYSVFISQDDYELDPNIYSLTLDVQTAHVRHVPYVPKNGPWSGFALTNGSDGQAAEVMMVTAEDEGRPLHTVLGPLNLGPGQRYLVNFSDLPVRLHEYAQTDSLKLISSGAVEMVNLFANVGGPMAGFSGDAQVSDRLIISDAYDNDPWDPAYMMGAVINESFADTEVVCDVHSAEGRLMRTITQNISARGVMQVRPGLSPFSTLPDGGWMEVYADASPAELTGYQYLKTDEGGSHALDTTYALPVVSGVLYVQHVTPPVGPWQTLLTLINPNAEDNPVTIHPARNGEKTANDATLDLAPFEKRIINVSEEFEEAARESILEISGRYPLAGQVRYQADKGDGVSYPLLNSDSFKMEMIMPHAAYNNGRWYTGVGVCNPNSSTVSVLITPHDQDGQAMAAAEQGLVIDPGAYKVFTVYEMFPDDAADISFLKIRCMDVNTAGIGGFYLYGNAAAQNLEPRRLVSGGNM